MISYLLTHAGSILRWRTAVDLIPLDSQINRQSLLEGLMACEEVHRWLKLLGSGPVHHSKDASAENTLAKLCEYGLHAGLPALDLRALPYCAIGDGEPYQADALILAPFLVRAGYAFEPRVASWIEQRIKVLYEQACRADYNFYMDDAERQVLPPSQQILLGKPKPFYRQHFNSHWNVLRLPTCYDLYALAYLSKEDPATRQKIETIVAYILQSSFQDTPGGYIWNPFLHRAYAAGRVFLACLPRENEREKLVLFLEIMAQFECGRASDWFRQGMAHLETFRTEQGTYCFPRHYLSEKVGYYLYSGMHMGLGELPRNNHALELESTFRMARLRSLYSTRLS